MLDPLSHLVFYPKMREMGLKPGGHQRETIVNMLNEYKDRKVDDWTPDGKVLTYFVEVDI